MANEFRKEITIKCSVKTCNEDEVTIVELPDKVIELEKDQMVRIQCNIEKKINKTTPSAREEKIITIDEDEETEVRKEGIKRKIARVRGFRPENEINISNTPNRRIQIFGLPQDTLMSDVVNLMENDIGGVVKVELIHGTKKVKLHTQPDGTNETIHSLNYALVEFKDTTHAIRAVKNLNRAYYKDHQVCVVQALPMDTNGMEEVQPEQAVQETQEERRRKPTNKDETQGRNETRDDHRNEIPEYYKDRPFQAIRDGIVW